MLNDDFARWFEALEQRHLRNLNFSEIRRGVQALSSLYVSRRQRLDRNSALDGAGKRAAFAMFYGPLHFLLVREIVRALDARVPPETAPVSAGEPLRSLGYQSGQSRQAGRNFGRQLFAQLEALATHRCHCGRGIA